MTILEQVKRQFIFKIELKITLNTVWFFNVNYSNVSGGQGEHYLIILHWK